MTSFVLVPGAGGVAAWYFHHVTELLAKAGHESVPVDLPGDDESAGLPEYARLVVEAIGGRDDVVLVAQSMGGFTAPMAAAAVPVRALVLVNAMIPIPGETPGAWGENTGASAARIEAAEEGGYGADWDEAVYFLHDVGAEDVAAGAAHQRGEADTAFGSVCAIDAWPGVPTRVVAGADDRLFPVAFQRRVARDRLGVEADVLPGGHLIALSRPAELTDYLLSV